MNEFDETVKPIKILVIGNSGVGKTSLLKRYTDETSELVVDDHESTIGLGCESKIVNINDKSYTLQIWDSAGQERFKTITSSFYQGADAIVLVFDLTNTTSFNDIHQWNREVERFKSGRIAKVLVGTKSDLQTERKVEENVANSLATSLKINYFETSAKTLDNVEEIFLSLAKLTLEIRKSNDDFSEEEETKKAAPTRVLKPEVKRQRNCSLL